MFEQLVTDILFKAEKLHATAAEVSISHVNGFTVNVRNSQIDTLEQNQDYAAGITLYFGKKSASVSTTDLAIKSIDLALEKASYIAKFTADDPYSGLAEKKLLAFDYPDLDLYHPANVSISAAEGLARECEATALAYDKRIISSEGVVISAHESFSAYGNTNDFIGSFSTTRYEISGSLVAAESGNKERDADYSVARCWPALMPAEQLATKIAKKCVSRLGAKKIPACKCPVIFQADVARALLAKFVAAISGGNLYRKSTFLLDSLGKQVFPSFINIDERPHLKNGFASRAFDRDGVKTTAKNIVTDGIVSSYLLGSYSARKLNMQTTGNAGGVHNLFINSANYNLAQLLKVMDKGLLITELMGQGVNLITGDYSRGAFGFWVENGEIQYPVHEITVAGNLRDMFQQIIAVANDLDTRSSIITGSILIENMTIC